MKKLLIVLLAAFFAISCSMQVSDKTGSLTLSGARGILNDPDGNPYTIRYSLTRNGKTIPLNNQVYLDVSGSDSATIDSLIPGDGYKLAVSVGNLSGNNFVVSSYGYSETFAISEGTNSAVNVALQNAPDFTWLTSTGGNSSAAVVGSTVNILDKSVLRTFNVSGPFPDINGEPSDTLSGVSGINSLSKGKYFPDGVGDELWLNTTTGIYSYNYEWTPNMNPGMSPNVIFSRAVEVDGSVIGLYSGGGSNIGFIYADAENDFTSTPGDGISPWQTAANYPAIADILPEISGDVIKSIAINQDNGESFFYVVTTYGTVIGSSGIDDIEDILKIGTGNWLEISDGSIPIKLVSTADTRVYAASTTGLYTAEVNWLTNLGMLPNETSFSFVSGTAGKKFVSMESYDIGDDSITAAVTDDNWVYLIQGDALLPSVPGKPNPLPAAAGIPLNAKPVFYNDGTNFHLIFSGTNGSVDYDTGIAAPVT